MVIKWFGHSCFLLTNSEGVSILTDPCAPAVGFDLHDIPCDAVAVSHDHFDHNYIAAVSGEPVVVSTVGKHEVGGVRIEGFEVLHDKQNGAVRGKCVMFVIEMDGIRVLHAGDIGQLPSEDFIKALGDIDVLLVPVGGKYTLDYAEARELANMLRPSVVIPMHYRTAKCKFNDIDDVNNFISTVRDCKIHRLNDCEATLSRQSLGEDRVLVLEPFDPER